MFLSTFVFLVKLHKREWTKKKELLWTLSITNQRVGFQLLQVEPKEYNAGAEEVARRTFSTNISLQYGEDVLLNPLQDERINPIAQ
jgi:hypothetical protein